MAEQFCKNKVSCRAVFCDYDAIAFGALKAFREKGINVPKDLELLSIDITSIELASYASPPLSVIKMPNGAMGAAAIDLLKKEQPGRKGFAVGTASMLGQLRDAGLDVSGEEWEDAEYLLIGFDRELTYRKIEDTCRLLAARPDIPYYATNPDWVCPTEFGAVPDCGSICEMIARATGCRPRVIGKPEKAMIELAMQRYGVSPEETVVVGDRVYTDIASGVNAGVDSIFVLSGEGVREDIKRFGYEPTWIFPSVSEAADAVAEAVRINKKTTV